MLFTLAEIGIYFTLIGNVFKFEQPAEKLVRMGKGTFTKGIADKNPEHSSSSPQPQSTPHAPDTIRTLRSFLWIRVTHFHRPNSTRHEKH